MEKEVEPYYQNQAKKIVDTLFDNKLFNTNLTRDDMNKLEDLIAFHFKCIANSTRKTTEILMKITKIN